MHKLRIIDFYAQFVHNIRGMIRKSRYRLIANNMLRGASRDEIYSYYW